MDLSSKDAYAKQRGQISIGHRAGFTTRNTGFTHCEQREVLRTSYTKKKKEKKKRGQCLPGRCCFSVNRHTQRRLPTGWNCGGTGLKKAAI